MKKCLLWVSCILVGLGNFHLAQSPAGTFFRNPFAKATYPPQTSYSRLHYWVPGLYTLKYHHRPFYYEQYTPVAEPGVIVEQAPPSTKKEILPPPQTEPKKEILPFPIPEPKKDVPPPNNELQPISGTTMPAQPARFPFVGNWVKRPNY